MDHQELAVYAKTDMAFWGISRGAAAGLGSGTWECFRILIRLHLFHVMR